MVMNLAFNNRNPEAPRWPDREWVNILTCKNRLFEMETYDEVTDRVQWYQLVANAKYIFDAADREPIYGTGSAYLSSYKDNTGAFLSGSNAYRLTVPASVPIMERSRSRTTSSWMISCISR